MAMMLVVLPATSITVPITVAVPVSVSLITITVPILGLFLFLLLFPCVGIRVQVLFVIPIMVGSLGFLTRGSCRCAGRGTVMIVVVGR